MKNLTENQLRQQIEGIKAQKEILWNLYQSKRIDRATFREGNGRCNRKWVAILQELEKFYV